MADITKCTGKDCQKKETCYRFTAPDSSWQSYANFYQPNIKCQHYWDNRKKQNGNVYKGTS